MKANRLNGRKKRGKPSTLRDALKKISERITGSDIEKIEVYPQGHFRVERKGEGRSPDGFAPIKERSGQFFFVVEGEKKGWASLSPGIGAALGIDSYPSVSQKTGRKARSIKKEVEQQGSSSFTVQGLRFTVYDKEV